MKGPICTEGHSRDLSAGCQARGWCHPRAAPWSSRQVPTPQGPAHLGAPPLRTPSHVPHSRDSACLGREEPRGSRACLGLCFPEVL